MSRVSPAQQPQHQVSDESPFPSLSQIEPVVEQVLAIARDQLEAPLSAKLWFWEDGEFKLRVRHSYPCGIEDDVRERTVIQYHSRTETVTGYLVEEDCETDELTLLLERDLATIPDPCQQTD